jgi:cytochrome c-type biogenesis protein CcmH
MMGFAIGATLMVIVALLLLLLPFRYRHPASADFSRQQLNTAIYRDQFAELERDRAEGALAQDDYDVARGELQRRLLEDSGSTADTNVPAATSRTVPAALAIALPLGAVLLYLLLGNPAALNPPPPEQNFTSDDIERMVSGLATKLEKEPGNLQGWAMLARSYKAMGRIPEALRAFERAIKLVETSPDLLVDYADALASSPAGFNAKVIALIDQALQLDPANAQALWLRGTAAFEAGKFDAAAADWQRLLALLEPGAEDARIVEANIAEARAKGGLPAAKPKGDVTRGNPRGTGGTAKGSAAAAIAVVTGRVELAAGLAGKVPAGGILMVVARPNDGSRMPVAVLRVPAGGLPLAFTLDDSLTMNPDRPLSQFPELQIEARISQSGQAMPQPGDLFGPAQTVKLGAAKVILKIDQVRQ